VEENCKISIVMGSQSDWPCLKNSSKILDELKVPYEVKIISAHRTPDRLFRYSEKLVNRGIKIVIAGAGGSAHLPGMIASKTIIPVLGVPVKSSGLNGIDSLLSIVQMPAGVPVGTLAIGNAGATNAGLLSVSIIALNDKELFNRLQNWRQKQTNSVKEKPDNE
tara:strand:+ start:754 stop:1245 length:492 start_codon:yes stop_codon:yes gene_type:complete